MNDCVNEAKILELIPDGIVTVDQDLVVLQINRAARRFLGIPESADPVGMPVAGIMEEADFLRLRDDTETRQTGGIRLMGDTRLECSFQSSPERDLFVCVMHDLTLLQEQNDGLSNHLHAAELADALCEKQLRLVSEIAGLLGESAVEMQAAVKELKQAVLPDRKDQNG